MGDFVGEFVGDFVGDFVVGDTVGAFVGIGDIFLMMAVLSSIGASCG